MKNTALVFGLVTSFGILVIALGLFFPVTPRVSALTNPCAADANNLTTNGSMYGPGRATSYGVVADGWNPFVQSVDVPNFSWENYNSNGDVAGTGSQYIWADLDPFDAGIYQTISGLSAGTYYRFWIGSALAAYDYLGQGNKRTDTIGRQVGVDRTGGTDPSSPNVVWGSVYWDGIAALNIPALSMVFTPKANQATIFLRVVNQNIIGRSKVWFDAVCMERMNPQPTLTPTAGPQYLPLIERKPAP